MEWPFEFWPIDLPPGPAFLAVFLVMFVGAVSLGRTLGKALVFTPLAAPQPAPSAGSP